MTAASYSPRRRTGVIFGGTGTAGAYQAGVLHALTDAGIKIDIVAGHGAGATTALFGAIDAGARLWDEAGPWVSPRLRRAYRWRGALRAAAIGLFAALLILLSPFLVLVAAAGVYAVAMLAGLAGMPATAGRLVDAYAWLVASLFDPPILPTIVPRAVVLALVVVAGVLLAAGLTAIRAERSRRRMRGAFWWQIAGTPLDGAEPGATMVDALWRQVRGASNEPRPAPGEIGRRYVDVLADNFGQPGFREVVVAVHDVDGRRDLVGAVLPPQSREAFLGRTPRFGAREAEMIDLTGTQRELLVDLVIGSLRLPVAMPPHPVHFPADSYWRGERHALCDRPELLVRLIDEVVGLGAEQIVLVSPAPPPAMPHELRRRPADLRGRIGDLLRSIETAALEDAAMVGAPRVAGLFVIRPDHNPVGPFDFAGVYDEASDRECPAAELIQQGFDDAYRQFIEPIVARGDDLTEAFEDE